MGIRFTRAGHELESLSESAGRAAAQGEIGRGVEFGMDLEGEMGMAGGEYGGEMAVDPALSPSPKKFPSLEEQKLTDIVYRRLGLELEPLTADDLQRVHKLGYEGGVRVAQNSGILICMDNQPNCIRPDDVLVGLHVWPTKSVQDVVDVIDRDDLHELNPLKFYVVRREPQSSGGFGMRPQERDEVVTGRIQISISKPPALDPQPKPHPRIDQRRDSAGL